MPDVLRAALAALAVKIDTDWQAAAAWRKPRADTPRPPVRSDAFSRHVAPHNLAWIDARLATAHRAEIPCKIEDLKRHTDPGQKS